jgi:hypothetical protein
MAVRQRWNQVCGGRLAISGEETARACAHKFKEFLGDLGLWLAASGAMAMSSDYAHGGAAVSVRW